MIVGSVEATRNRLVLTLSTMFYAFENKSFGRLRRPQLSFVCLLGIIWLASGRELLPQQTSDQSAQLAEAEQLHDQGLKLYGEGKYDEAINLATRELAIREKWLKGDDLYVAESLQMLGMLYREKGEYARSEPLYQRALRIREKVLGQDDPRVATTLSHLGQLSRLKGDYAQAESQYQRALAIREKTLGADDPFVATSLNNLALIYVYLEDYSKAEALYERALKVYERTVGPDDSYVATVLSNLAQISWQKGELAQSKALLQRAVNIEQKQLGFQHPALAQSLSNLATIYAEEGNAAEAERLYDRALNIRENTLGREHPLVASLLNNLSLLFQGKGNPQQAIRLQERANDIREKDLKALLTGGSEKQKQSYLAVLAGEMAGTISLHVNTAPNSPLAIRLALTTVLRRKGRVLDAMSSQIETLRGHLSSEDVVLFDQLVQKRARLSTRILQGAEARSPEQYRLEISELNGEVERLEASLSARSAEFRLQSEAVTIERVQQAIPADAALVEFVAYKPFDPAAKTRIERWKPTRYVAYVLRRVGMPAWVKLDGEASTIDNEVTKLRAATRNPARTDIRTLARALDERIMRSLRTVLGDARRILLSPDGALNLVPFAVLVDEEGHFLVEKYDFIYLTSGRDLLRFGKNLTSGHENVVIASPAFDQVLGPNQADSRLVLSRDRNQRGRDFAQHFKLLTGAIDEAKDLGKLLDVEPRIGEQATETALKKVNGPRILHIATHGFFLANQKQKPARIDPLGNYSLSFSSDEGENPLLRSGLAFAGANNLEGGSGEDGILTALEASSLNLWGTGLVVLSACETGLGEIQNGEGVYGLRRALVLAGAESQLLSLWKVDDEMTRDLMVRYYTQLLVEKRGRSEALRQIQLERIATRGESNDESHPYYWASFIQSGQWKNLEERDTR